MIDLPPDVRLLRLAEVEQRVGLKKSQIYQLMSQGKFPKAVKISAHASGWLEHEIRAFIAERVAASRGGVPAATGGTSGGTSHPQEAASA